MAEEDVLFDEVYELFEVIWRWVNRIGHWCDVY